MENKISHAIVVMSAVFNRACLSAMAALTAATFLLSVPAYAFRGGDSTNIGAVRHDSESPNRLKISRYEGSLTCDMGTENTGQGCDLKFHDTKTGKTYGLTDAKGAMALFQDGKKNVIIDGRLADAETIEVKEAQVL